MQGEAVSEDDIALSLSCLAWARPDHFCVENCKVMQDNLAYLLRNCCIDRPDLEKEFQAAGV